MSTAVENHAVENHKVAIVGSIVWYHTIEDGILTESAAIVTRVLQPQNPGSDVALTVFRVGRAPDAAHQSVRYSAAPAHGCWCWPKS